MVKVVTRARAYAHTRFVLFMRMLVAMTMPLPLTVLLVVWPDGKADQFPETSETPLEPPLTSCWVD